MRGRRHTGVILAVLAVAVAMVAACPAGAMAKPKGTPQPLPSPGLFGTTIWEPPTAEEYSRMAAGGISHMKLLISANVIAPQPAVRDWRLYDQIVGAASVAGISIDPWFFQVPSWMSAAPATLPVQNQAERLWWFGFVRDVARRYGPGGSFWAENPGIPARPMRDWEVWNEPNIAGMTGPGGVSVRSYAQLLGLTREALRQASPDNQVVLGGLYRRPRRGFGPPMTRYLERLYKLKRGRSLFDVVAIHPYAALPRQVLAVTQSIRRVMNANRDGRKPLWITELGWTTGGQDWAQSLYRATPEQQAVRLSATARLLMANRRGLRLQRVDWHTWRDREGTNDFWDGYMGLFTADGHPKPVWSAFTQVTGGFAGGQILHVGHFAPFGPVLPPGGSPKPPPPSHNCLLPGILC
jgi:hypothetical protein